jgi:predicted transcriptional regulator
MSLLISEEELDHKLNSAEVVYHRLGQGSNDAPRPRSDMFRSGIPDFVRKIISGEARSEVASNVDIADSWGISPTAVRYAEEGRIGAHQLKGEEIELVEDADKIAQDIVTKTIRNANAKLATVIEGIKDDDLKNEKPLAATVIARNLASVVEKLQPKVIAQTNIQFNVFTPKKKKLEDFGEPIRVIEQQVKR